jgi:hypothetical protein
MWQWEGKLQVERNLERRGERESCTITNTKMLWCALTFPMQTQTDWIHIKVSSINTSSEVEANDQQLALCLWSLCPIPVEVWSNELVKTTGLYVSCCWHVEAHWHVTAGQAMSKNIPKSHMWPTHLYGDVVYVCVWFYYPCEDQRSS